MPDAVDNLTSQYYSQVAVYLDSMDSLSEITDAVDSTRGFILMSGVVALIFGFLWMVIMRSCAGPITWTAIILFIACCFGLSYYTYTLGIKK